jgi:hypothetical protein
MSGEDCVIEAKAARRQGRLVDATALYEQAAEAYRNGGEPARWAHSLRHAAEFAVKAGDGQTGLREARAVVEYYRIDPPPTLEMANALRVAALAEDAAGEKANSMQYWSEARSLYADAGVAQGVMEAERHVAVLASA